MELQITQIDPVTGVVTMGIPPVPRILRGIDKLAQIVTLYMLRNPGQDVLDPTEGTGFRDMIGQYNFTSPEEVRAVVSQRIKQAEKQLLAAQPVGVGTASERLKSLTLKDMVFDSGTSGLFVRIRLVSEAGSEADLVV